MWSRDELEGLVDFAEAHSLAVLCDEIHSDIILGERPFVSLASLARARELDAVVFSGPNKTFNVAGLHICQAIARGAATRAAMRRAISAWGFGLPNAFSLVAAIAAYREGGPWLDELLAYLKGNHRFLLDFVGSRLAGIRAPAIEGSYLAWLDARELLAARGAGHSDATLARELEESGRVRFSPGSSFGIEGSGYLRLNFACPRSILSDALERVARSLVFREHS